MDVSMEERRAAVAASAARSAKAAIEEQRAAERVANERPSTEPSMKESYAALAASAPPTVASRRTASWTSAAPRSTRRPRA